MSELFEELPEVGNPDKPKLVFFFDEAHLLFDDAPKVLVNKVEQVARLILSKGVGVLFVTQNPADVPEDVLGQLGNRVQHALRAFTANDQKALRQASATYRPNPRFDTAEAIMQVGTGEAVTSMLDVKGVLGIVERTLIRPPSSQLGLIDPATRAALMAAYLVAGKYDQRLDRDSAAEMLARRANAAAEEAEAANETREFTATRRYGGSVKRSSRTAGAKDEGLADAPATAFVKEMKGTTGRRIIRGILGSMFKSR